MIEQKNRQPERLANRFFLRIAGRRLRAYSIVPHVGRRSGREYRNPVGAYPLGDGFVIAVLYGRESQWVRNVMASGRFTLRTKGRDYSRARNHPSSQALAAYPRLWRSHLESRKIDEFVWAHRAASSTASSPSVGEHDELMSQHEQLDVFGELAARAIDQQPQHSREGEIGERKEHAPMFPSPATEGSKSGSFGRGWQPIACEAQRDLVSARA